MRLLGFRVRVKVRLVVNKLDVNYNIVDFSIIQWLQRPLAIADRNRTSDSRRGSGSLPF